MLLTAGGQHALHATMTAILTAGDLVCVGRHVYPGFLSLARKQGLSLGVVDADAEGLDPDALDAVCRTRRPKAVYLVPTNDNPTTATMSKARRAAIVDVARRHDLMIIEDDAYGQLAAAPLPALAALAPERTWHIASTSKIISPALRVAFVRAPSVQRALQLTADLHDTTIMAAPLNAAMVTRWIDNGTYDRLVSEVRAETKWRRALAAEILGAHPFAAQPEGYHLWIPLQPDVPLLEILNTLRPVGLSIVPAAAFAVETPDNHVRVSIGGTQAREQITRNLRLLDALLSHRSGRPTPLV